MGLTTAGLTRAEVAYLLGLSDGRIGQLMRAGALPRPGREAPDYVAAFVVYRERRRD